MPTVRSKVFLCCGSWHFLLCIGVTYTQKFSLVRDANAYLTAGSPFSNFVKA